jgi:hypothetical protein
MKMSGKSYAPPTWVLAEKLVRDIRLTTRKRHSAEDKIRIVLEGRCSEESIENIEKLGAESFTFSVPFPAPVAT